MAEGAVGAEDAAGKIFGTVSRSSRLLIRDARADGDWSAARLHMHAEDEFSAGSYGSAKRDAVRVLSGAFPVRIVVEGKDNHAVAPLVAEIDTLVALGALAHLPIGGHKTHGAGWGRWEADKWEHLDVNAQRTWEPAENEARVSSSGGDAKSPEKVLYPKLAGGNAPLVAHIEVVCETLPGCVQLTLGQALQHAEQALGQPPLAWWCEPSIDFSRAEAPVTFGTNTVEDQHLRVDEVAFFTDTASWRAARCRGGWRTVLIREAPAGKTNALRVDVVQTPAWLHEDGTRFAAKYAASGDVMIREWRLDGQIVGFTLTVNPGETAC